jgi:hypothetical protein
MGKQDIKQVDDHVDSKFKHDDVINEETSERERSYQDTSLRQSNNDNHQASQITGDGLQHMFAPNHFEGNLQSEHLLKGESDDG